MHSRWSYFSLTNLLTHLFKDTYSKFVAHSTKGISRLFQVEDLQCGVPGLEPGHRYMFRVKAVNEEGESEPLVTEKETLAKDPWGNILA